MEQQMILICEDSDAGILTGVYEAYERKLDHARTRIQVGGEENLCLFSEYIKIEPVLEKAQKVIRTIERRFGKETLRIILEALGSTDKEKGNAVYHMIVHGLRGGYAGQLIDCLSEDAVIRVIALSTTVWHEYHHFYGFLRFQEVENGMLYAMIHPKNRILSFLGDHFADRLPQENFMIYDEVHGMCVIHGAGKDCALVDAGLMTGWDRPVLSHREREIQDLFCYFCERIAICGRNNEALRKQLLPLRFRPDMVEF